MQRYKLFLYNETYEGIVDDIDRLKQKAKQNRGDSAWLWVQYLYFNLRLHKISSYFFDILYFIIIRQGNNLGNFTWSISLSN